MIKKKKKNERALEVYGIYGTSGNIVVERVRFNDPNVLLAAHQCRLQSSHSCGVRLCEGR